MRRPRRPMRGSVFIAAVSVLWFSGCGSVDGPGADYRRLTNIDPTLGLNRDDYRHINAPKAGDKGPTLTIDKGMPPIPQLADILAAPRPPKIGETQLVSIAVTDDVPLKDMLLELAKLADVDIELDAGITGGISFVAKDKPFNEVIDRVCDLAGLRYSMKSGILRIERDTPYIKSYPIDFLNLDRDSTSAVNLSTNVLSSTVGSGGGGGGALNTGSTSSVKSTTSGDFWKSLNSGVEQILSYVAPQHVSDTTLDADTDANMLMAVTGPSGAPAGAPAGAPGSAPPRPNPAPRPAPAQAQPIAKGSYTINRQAGVLTVDATSKQHEMIERLLEMLKKNASSQVLIEAKIIEVDLTDQYQAGVNWQVIGQKLAAGATFNSVGNAISSTTFNSSATASPNVVSFAANNPNDILSMVETFGTVRTLSSPRLHAINNQQSTMTFAENKVYFTVTVTPSTTTTTGTVTTAPTAPTVSSSIQTVPIGVMMTLMPSIDMENNEITLSVRPTLSTIIDYVTDPAVAIEAQEAGVSNFQNLIPEVQVRELDSTLKVKSGQTIVIGGLMQQTSNNTDTGVPFASSVPVLGNLFKSVSKKTQNTELVLLIKATIVNAGGSLGATDANVFHKFSDDPRPVSF